MPASFLVVKDGEVKSSTSRRTFIKQAPAKNSGAASPERRKDKSSNFAMLSLGALGVVFGDIGTSPLYAMRQCFQNLHASVVDAGSVLGILCLIFWSLILVVCVKYATFILRADHDGQGGTLAMLALIHTKRPHADTRSPGALILMVLAGSALLYGDGVITPAISVLSAVEGVKVATPEAQHFVVPVALGILVGLFLLQHRGTETVGMFFGPIMALWFVSIAGLGVTQIARYPGVLQALNPAVAFQFLTHHGSTGVVVLGGVVLCLTGAEALFADLSHFGRFPIKLAWYGFVLPALLLNYFGEGAMMLQHPTEIQNPFFSLVPHVLLWPMVILATLATIIASQALISGIFTLTEQAIYMGYFPRFKICHTSKKQRGQVYIGAINYALMLACAGVILGFRSSEKLGAAYGLAVIGTMIVTSMTYLVVVREIRKWSRAKAFALGAFFLLLDTSFLAGNIVKILSGAWLPLAIASLVFGIFWIWTECGTRFRRSLNSWAMSIEDFAKEMRDEEERQEGTGIFLTTRPEMVPLVGKNHWLRGLAQHEQILLVTVDEKETPYVRDNEIVQIEDLGRGLWRVTASFGFMQQPDIIRVLKSLPRERLVLDWDKLVCYLPEATFELRGSWWRRRINFVYDLLRRNSLSAAQYFQVPPREIALIGVKLEV
ncbi:MAG TPA: KUP/HAK/KT family potassium transporter [Candidatus Methylacidiphilales bacterium]|nr:KUP/HAK/KT family potassium transporter [Candidatus Methylacidiphilales bacterium]